ncbi:hypothetical protein BDQ12DRAFT_637276 [Crucibulum laeve]|uniref:Transmembrane protein n=1 Tax=Crucibulum laeve TaxID=68775 RepID=A0A5C3LMS2_9AGAR|nr:hypothetical protein BDQ12DRAFT_637276 [Crucibulum laeve]
MANARELSLIVDDKSDKFHYGGGDWTLSALSVWYGGTSPYPDFAISKSGGDSGVYGSMNITFDGTSIALWGNTPPSFNSQFVVARIDDGTPYNSSYNDPNPQSYRQWYKSPKLAEGTHILWLDRIAGTSLDYAIINAGRITPLKGETIIVDDDDSAISYSGSWREIRDRFNSGSLPDGTPFGNGTHQSNTVGDHLTFKFTGTSVAAYGIFSWASLSAISATFTLDGSSVSQTYSVLSNSPQYQNEVGQEQNYLLFSYDSLELRDHTLVINITTCVNQSFILDYITYKPSFDTLAVMPNISMASSPIPASSEKAPLGAIIGGAVGGSMLLLFAIFLFLWARRKSKKFDMEYGRRNLNTATPNFSSELFVPFMSHFDSSPVTPFQLSMNPSSSANFGSLSVADLKRMKVCAEATDASSRSATQMSSLGRVNDSRPSGVSRSTGDEGVIIIGPSELAPPAYDDFPSRSN